MEDKKGLATEGTTRETSPARDFWTNLAALLKVKTIITLVIISAISYTVPSAVLSFPEKSEPTVSLYGAAESIWINLNYAR